MRIFGKILSVPGIGIVKTASIVLSIIVKIASVVTGPLLVFVAGCSIYCGVVHEWRNLTILLMIGGIIVLFCILSGVVLGLLDIAVIRMKSFIRS